MNWDIAYFLVNLFLVALLGFKLFWLERELEKSDNNCAYWKGLYMSTLTPRSSINVPYSI